MLSQPQRDRYSRSLTALVRPAVFTTIAIAFCLFVSACSGGGGGSGSGSSDGNVEVGSLWPQADSVPPGAFDTTLPAAVESVRYVFRSDTGFSCCVVIDPDDLSGNRAITLQSVPAGPATLQVSGYPTSFAGAPEGVTETCDIDPRIGRTCSRNRSSSASFDSGPRSIDVVAGGSTNAGDVPVRSVPFVLLPSLVPAQNASVNNPVPIEFTVVEAIFGVDPSTVGAALIPLGGSRRNLTVVLRACTDGTATPCSANGQLKVRGFISNADDPQVVPSGTTAVEISARNLAPTPAAMQFEYGFTVAPVVPTATPPRSATPTRGTPSLPTNTPPSRTRTPTVTATRPATFTPSITRTPKDVSVSFVRATSFGVSQEPSHMAVGDFNRDGRDDVAVASPESKEVHILLGNPDGSFTPGTVVPSFGTFPAWIVAGDLNGDAFVDLAVADERAGGVYLMFGGANATFSTPSLRSIGRRPFAVAIGNFDRATGNDLAVTDRDANRVLILLNNGLPSPTFRNGGNAPVGAEPADIVAADFNLDGALDVATLNNGGAAVKDVTILIYNRIEGGLVVFNRVANLVVGDRPLDLLVAELNSDSRPDLVMLNRPANDGFGEVNYLLSHADGLLTQTDPLVAHCPDRTVNCRARALAVGDFDNDGVSDVALTLNQAGQGTETDVMQIFLGSGDGAFIPGPILPTEGQPLAMATGDFTGDGLTDVIVTSAQTDSVQVYVNVRATN